MKIKYLLVPIVATLVMIMVSGPAFAVAGAVTIGGCIYEGAQVPTGSGYGPDFGTATPITGATVMVQNQHSGGAFITYGTTGLGTDGNCWTASVDEGDYVIMFSAPDHDLTSREVTVAGGAVTHPKQLTDGSIETSTDPDAIDAYLPPLPVPKANLLVYAFYDNQVNGEDDAPDDPPLNGVEFTVKDEEGNLLATGKTGTQASITLPDGTIIANTDGLYYFTELPPGEVIITSDPSDVYNHSNPDFSFDASTEFYLMTSEEGGPAWDPKLYPGDPGTEDGSYLIWHGYVEKLGQFGDPTNPNPFNPAIAGSISGVVLDADGNDPEEPFPDPGPPGVSPNTIVPDSFIVLFSEMETIKTQPVATVEADPVTGEYKFINVPPGRYKMFLSDIPIDYVWVQQQVTVFPTLNWPASPLVPRFFARGRGYVYDDSTGLPIAGAKVHIRYKDGSIQKTEVTDASGWYNFDDLPEIEVMGYVDVELPAGYRGAMKTDTFQYNLPAPYVVTHNAMNRYIQWYTANYQADLYLEPIPPGEGDIRGFVYNDHLATGTWIGDGLYDREEERTMHDVTVELWDSTETTLISTTTTGGFDKAATLAQGWHEPYTIPPDELGGVYVGPLPGYYEFRGLAPGDYTVKVIAPGGFSPSPAGSDVAVVTVTGGSGTEHNVGINTLVPLAGEIEGGVFDDLNVDPRAYSLLFEEKAGIDYVPVGVYDHLGYLLGAGYMGNPLCYAGSTYCPPGEDPVQKPEMERRFAPGVHIYYGNDPAFPGYNPNYVSLILPYTFGQGKYKFEADWSLPPLAWLGMGVPLDGEGPILSPGGPEIEGVDEGGSYVITGSNFGDEQGYSTVTLSGQELEVISWSDDEIHVQDTPDDVSGPMLVTTAVGPSNGWDYDTGYTPAGSVFVDASNTGGDGSEGNPYSTITEALNNLPPATPRYVFVAPGTYNERLQITEDDIHLIGAGPLETTIDGHPGPLSISHQGVNGNGPVFFIGAGGENGSVENIMISGFTITGGTVKDDIGAGIFGDYGNSNIDLNNSVIVRNGGYYGGGIWLHLSNHDVRIWSNTIAENGNYGGYAGGISVNDEPEYGPEHGEPEHVWDDHCPPTCTPPGTYEIFNNHIFHNFSPDYGGGISLYEVKDHLQIFGNVIEDNKADDHGGGTFFEDTGPIDIHHNKFLRNYSRDDGGAISFEDVGDDIALVKIYNNLFAENIADDCGENTARGGALAFDDTFYVEVYNNTIANNIVAGSLKPAGGGIDSERHGHEYNGSIPPEEGGRDIAPGYSDPKIYNNIIWGNMRLEYEQPLSGEEEDLCYDWGVNYDWTPDNLHVDNPAEQPEWQSQNNSESFTHVEYNDISEDDYDYSGRVGNISADPQFVALSPADWYLDPENKPMGDWHLRAGSPAIDRAPVDDAPRDDLDRHPRSPRHAMVDMGAYEYQWPNPGSLTIIKEAVPADGLDFSFTGDLGSFSLDDALPDDGDGITDTITYAGLGSDSYPETYAITETIPGGWVMLDVGCVSDENNDFDLITDPNDGLIGTAVHLEEGENITCTITNTIPAISFQKSTNGVDADKEPGPAIEVGTPVVWTYQIQNTGLTPLTDISLEDKQLPDGHYEAVSCAEGAIPNLDPGDSFTCTVSGGIAAAGQYRSQSRVTARYSSVEVRDWDKSHYFGFEPVVWSNTCVQQRMEITGIGMGDRDQTINPQSLALADPGSVNWLLAQMARYYGKTSSRDESATFITDAPQSIVLTETKDGSTFEANLQPAGQVTATLDNPGTGAQTPRGLILYSQRATPDEWTSVGKTMRGFAYQGWGPEFEAYTEVLSLSPLEKATNLYITAVVIDNNDDERSMVLEATAGGVTQSVTELGPTDGEGLNIVNLTLAQVLTGTDQVTVTLRSPSDNGDSLVLLGLNAGYLCSDDSDGDGISNTVEGTDDADGDGTPNYLDLDSDGDGIFDDAEYYDGGNDDALCTGTVIDSDGDGTPNCLDNDADGDGTPNYLDLDSDGDGIPDSEEGLTDSNDNGIPDFLEPEAAINNDRSIIYLPIISK